jgi:hypothetical protein
MKPPFTNNLTLVFTIKDHAAFEFERQRLLGMFTRDDNAPYSITALSVGHEIQRIELLEQAAELRDWDMLDEIFGLINPTEYSIIDGELRK